MKKIFSIIIILCSLLILGCNKKDVEPVNFDVTVPSANIKVGDTLNFNFTGNPYFITFYSGEKGHKYEYRDRTVAEGNPYFSFSSYRQYGSSDSTLRVLVSDDFSGSYTTKGVDSATWTNITGSCILSSGVDNTASGNIDLTSFTSEDNKPIYIAFHYIDSNMIANKRTWTISNFLVNNVLKEDNSTVSVVSSVYVAGFTNVAYSNALAANIWTAPTTTSGTLKITGGTAAALSNNNMAISKAILLSSTTPDVGVAIKEISVTISSYSYIYTEPGTYVVTFVARNENVYGASETIKTMTISVEN